MTDPKVEHLRDSHAVLAAAVAAGGITQAQALATLHRFCDRLWPPATINGRPANP